jgi:HlyD family secretion protein
MTAGLARKHPRWTAGGAIGLLLVLALLLTTGGEGTPATAYYEVKRGDFTVSIVEGGTLQAVKEVSIRNEVEGTARVIYIVREGSYVKEGDLLVELDAMQAKDQYSQQQINFEKAQFALVQAEQQFGIQKSVVESEIRGAELKLEFARMDLDKYLKGESMVNLLTASNNITKTEAQLSIDRETLRWSDELVKKGYETKNVLDRDRLTVTNQQLNLEIQSMQLWMIQNYDFPKKRREFESGVEEAGKELDRVKQQGERKLAQYAADLITQSNTLSLNAKKLERDKKNLDATNIKAPQGGLVVYPISEGRFSSESMIEEGATVRNRQELIKLPDTSQMKVTVRVHEAHVNMVQPGQPAYVVLDSMPDQRFRAVVEKVALLPDTQARWGNPNLKVYNTDVVITDSLPDIKPGVSARAEIIITNIANTIAVPIQAVTTLKGRQVVYTRRGGDSTPIPVEVGLFNTRFIQIVSGVSAGDRVLLSPPFDSQEKDLEGALLAQGEKVDTTNFPPRRATTEIPDRTTPNGPPADPSAAASAEPGSRDAGVQSGSRRGRSGPGGSSGADTNSPEARQMRQQVEAMRKQFDKDGNGELDETERQAMREEMQKRFGDGAGRGPRNGGTGDRGGGDRRGNGQPTPPSP